MDGGAPFGQRHVASRGRAVDLAGDLPDLEVPPGVRAWRLPSRSVTAMLPPEVFRSALYRAGTVTTKLTLTGGQFQ